MEWIVLNVTVGQNLFAMSVAHPVKIDLNKKLDPKQKTIRTYNVESQRFRKPKKENPPMLEIGVAS